MKSACYEPPGRWLQVILLAIGFLAIAAALAIGQHAPPLDAAPYVTAAALEALTPGPPAPELWGAVWRESDGSVTFHCPPGETVLLGVAVLPPPLVRIRPLPGWGGNFGPPVLTADPSSDWLAVSWPFLHDPRIEALPRVPTPWGLWRSRDWPRWVVTGTATLPLPRGPHVIQPATITGGVCTIRPPLLIDR